MRRHAAQSQATQPLPRSPAAGPLARRPGRRPASERRGTRSSRRRCPAAAPGPRAGTRLVRRRRCCGTRAPAGAGGMTHVAGAPAEAGAMRGHAPATHASGPPHTAAHLAELPQGAAVQAERVGGARGKGGAAAAVAVHEAVLARGAVGAAQLDKDMGGGAGVGMGAGGHLDLVAHYLWGRAGPGPDRLAQMDEMPRTNSPRPSTLPSPRPDTPACPQAAPGRRPRPPATAPSTRAGAAAPPRPASGAAPQTRYARAPRAAPPPLPARACGCPWLCASRTAPRRW